MTAIAKATLVSPRSLAYTYKATVKVADEDSSAVKKSFSTRPKPAVNNRAADSPTIRPIDKIQPVTIPSIALGSTTVRTICHLLEPIAREPSR